MFHHFWVSELFGWKKTEILTNILGIIPCQYCPHLLDFTDIGSQMAHPRNPWWEESLGEKRPWWWWRQLCLQSCQLFHHFQHLKPEIQHRKEHLKPKIQRREREFSGRGHHQHQRLRRGMQWMDQQRKCQVKAMMMRMMMEKRRSSHNQMQGESWRGQQQHQEVTSPTRWKPTKKHCEWKCELILSWVSWIFKCSGPLQHNQKDWKPTCDGSFVLSKIIIVNPPLVFCLRCFQSLKINVMGWEKYLGACQVTWGTVPRPKPSTGAGTSIARSSKSTSMVWHKHRGPTWSTHRWWCPMAGFRTLWWQIGIFARRLHLQRASKAVGRLKPTLRRLPFRWLEVGNNSKMPYPEVQSKFTCRVILSCFPSPRALCPWQSHTRSRTVGMQRERALLVTSMISWSATPPPPTQQPKNAGA